MNDSDNVAQRLIESEQVTVRAVVVPDGEDPTPYLLKAGIVEPIEVPFAWDDDEAASQMMGSGWTSGVPATLEFDSDEQDSFGPDDEQADVTQGQAVDEPQQEARLRTVQLPEAFGMKPMAPVLRRR